MPGITIRGPQSVLTNGILSTAAGIRAYAATRVSVVDGYIDNLTNAVLQLQAPTIEPQFPTGGSAPALAITPPPEFDEPVWVSPGFPQELAAVLDVGDLEIEPFDADPPTLNYGAPPELFTGAIPEAPEINLDFDDPTLSVSLPAPPSLLSISVLPFSGFNLPTFDAEEPVLTAVEPSIREYTPGQDYTSALLMATQEALRNRITNGGSGFSQSVENAIWDRGREREARAQRDAIEKLDEMEQLGYALPPGIYLDARTRIFTETDFAERGHSREVMIEAARLEQENVRHALTSAVQLESQLMDYTNAVEQRIFEATRYATEAGISIFNAKVQVFSQLVDAYRAKVQIYEARIRAETSRVEAYRVQVAAEEAKASINRSLVEQYRVQVDAALSNIRIFEAEIAGIQAKAEIERAKISVFGEQVRGYTAQVNAYTAGVEGFRATIQGETAKQQAYQSQVDAFRARVEANARQIDSRVEAYRGLIQAKTAEYDGYRAAVAGESARIEGISRTNSVRAEAYRSEVTAQSSFNDALTRQWQATLDQNQRVAEIAISAARANAELYVTTRSLSLDAAKTGAQVASQIGAAALNAVNFSGSVSSSESYGENVGQSDSFSQSQSDSTSNSTNYNYNASI